MPSCKHEALSSKKREKENILCFDQTCAEDLQHLKSVNLKRDL
jgi:hypothetical protein